MRLLLWGSKTNFVELKVDKQKNLGYHNLFPNQRKQLLRKIDEKNLF